jgi:hypothetical protein
VWSGKLLKEVFVMEKQFNNVKLADWFEWLALNMLKVDFYYSNDNKTIAKAVLEELENHPARGWGWSWVSIFDLYYHHIEPWEELSKEEKEELIDLLFEYIEQLASDDG